MIFPIGDTQVKGGSYPIVSYTLIAVNIIIFLVQMMTTGSLICDYSTIPQEIYQGDRIYTLFTSMFLHGGLMHLIGNMLFLWIFGDNIEATIGSFKFTLIYIGGGIIGSLAHIYFDGGSSTMIMDCCVPCQYADFDCGDGIKPCEGYIPVLGASGAISTLMGAYLIMFPKSQIKVLVIFLFRSVYVSAWLFLVLWFGQQLISGIGSIAITSATKTDVAWWAHIGGFVAGIICGYILKSEENNKIL